MGDGHPWLATVGAQYFMTAEPGLGGLVIDGRDRVNMSLVMLSVVLLGLAGWLPNRCATTLEHRLLR